jgi:site-specific DNA-methyltransferase (cytosine-N4-specific)
MLTDRDDMVVDPFGGSCVTGEVCERLERQWQCIELSEEYLKGASGRFEQGVPDKPVSNPQDEKNYYRIPRPGILWNGHEGEHLPPDGGQKRRKKTNENISPGDSGE